MSRKKLIEVALPLAIINDSSAREKNAPFRGHPRSIHPWWARRPHVTCRVMLFASLVDDPGEYLDDEMEAHLERERLFDIIMELAQWENGDNENVLGEVRREIARSVARQYDLNIPEGEKDVGKFLLEYAPPILDPFAGGGTIPLEAKRLGLKSYASDLNPVAVLINKGLIEIPSRFSSLKPISKCIDKRKSRFEIDDQWTGASGLAEDVRFYGKWISRKALEKIGNYYPDVINPPEYGGGKSRVLAWLWARTVTCPNPACKAEMPLVRSFELSSKNDHKVRVEPLANHSSIPPQIQYSIKNGKGGTPPGTVDRGGAHCIACGTPVPLDYIRKEGQNDRLRARLLAIVSRKKGKKIYLAPNNKHEEIVENTPLSDVPETYLPDRALGFRVQNYGMVKHRDLYNQRELLAMTTFSDLIKEVHTKIREDAIFAGFSADDIPFEKGGVGAYAYADAISTYLGFVLGKCTDYWNTIATWYKGGESIRNCFARQTVQMTWDYAEPNVFGNSSGSWNSMLDLVIKTVANLPADGVEVVEQQNAEVAFEDQKGHFLISTDPPYYDNIGYADLSDIFYIWLRRSLGSIYPDLLATMLTPKSGELIANRFRFDGNFQKAKSFFEEGLLKVFSNLRKVGHPDYPMTVFYAFKQAEIDSREGRASTGWETMLEGLIQNDLQITGTWPVRTERLGRMRDIKSNALASSIVLVCRRRSKNAPMISRPEFLKVLRKELPGSLHKLLLGNLAPVDLAQASIGPGMTIYSRYSQVLEPNGERLTVRTALKLVNQEMDVFLAKQEGNMDSDSRFAIAWFEQYGFQEGSFGQADLLARAKNTSVDGLAAAGVLESGAGKVRLDHWSEFEPGWDPTKDRRLTVWEATHHLIERLNAYGEEGAAQLLARMPSDLAAEARQLAYRLYSMCERKGWAEHAHDYNALVISWSASQEQAREFRDQYQQGTLF